jgi:hypothetical protein
MIFLPGDWGTTTPVAGTLLASLCDDYRLWEADGSALLGGFIGRAAGWYREGDPVGSAMAVVGSIVLLVLYRLIARGPRGA